VKKILAVVLIAIFVASMVFMGTACKTQTAAQTTAAAETTAVAETTAAETTAAAETSNAVASSDQLYVEVSALNSLEYFYDHKVGMEEVGKDLGVKTEFTGPSDYDMNAVTAAIDQAVAKGAKGIVVVGWEESINGAIDKAIESGVPVITVDADLPTSKRLAFVGTSNFQAGVDLGNWVAEKLGGKGTVALLGMPTLSNIRDREDGVKSVFDKLGIKIVQVGDSKTDSAGAAQTAAEILIAHPDLSAILGMDSHSGAGIGTAIKEANMTGKILATGFDRDNSLLELIDEGVVTATVVQRTALMPYYGVVLLWQLQNSKVALSKDDKALKILNIPNFVDTGIMIVEKDGAKGFIR
jgi:ribose transport system substrate-binding protein